MTTKPQLTASLSDLTTPSFGNGWILRHGQWHRRNDLFKAGFSHAEIDAMHQDPDGRQCAYIVVSATEVSP